MPIVSRDHPEPPPSKPHEARRMAESFGVDAQRYDQARPGYPAALVTRIINGTRRPDVHDIGPEPLGPDPHVHDTGPGTPGTHPHVLDVGCGTGIAARQFQAAGCTVLGVEPDARMAAFAQSRGLNVEVATFEAWQPAGRTFDAVVAAQSWHWVDPSTGATKAAQVLRPGGRLAIFGHAYEPPAEVAEPFAAAFRQAAPDSPFHNGPARRPLDLYRAAYAKVAGTINETGHFGETEQWHFDWQQSYTRDQWLALLPTTGGLTSLRPGQLTGILNAVGDAIDSLGGRFTMNYTTLAVTAVRHGTI
ncbi:class I SAM-dependent methyltransferase [Streptomyces sp. OR43]|uniref:class I SAM-dependent methyltransferase n=1 Tax=Streptomyces sp. or43 TaxID=2478957 RepID=UPI0011CDD79F|nr:class I SAM-dependent methyltransferase [Streptomyces sp. or43]TXS43966.1 class I SAM-dependent methyltransferase [Streptomyces sp. or43]